MSDHAISRAYVKRKRRKPPSFWFWYWAFFVAGSGSFCGFAIFRLLNGDTGILNILSMFLQGAFLSFYFPQFLQEYRKWRDDDE